MISAGTIISRLRNVGLDAQPNTDYFTDADDLLPAIDSSVKWIVAVINAAKAQNKATEEALRELSFCKVYVTSKQSRIEIEDSVWTIDAVCPLCETESNGGTPPTPPTDDFESYERTDLVYIGSGYQCYRKTIEEVNNNLSNPFSPGFTPNGANISVGSNDNVTYAYIPSYNYNNPSSAQGTFIEILPLLNKKLCAIFYVKNHPAIVSANDNILFPESAFNLIYEKALQFISYSQGDQTNIWGVTDKDINNLLGAIV
jgi:hypothetical protein